MEQRSYGALTPGSFRLHGEERTAGTCWGWWGLAVTGRVHGNVVCRREERRDAAQQSGYRRPLSGIGDPAGIGQHGAPAPSRPSSGTWRAPEDPSLSKARLLISI